MKKMILALIVFLFVVPLNVYAGLDEGLAAYNKKDYETALKEWQPLADQGGAKAQHNLGLMYENGQGVTKDYKQAVQWYTKAAEQGYADSQLNLALKYYFGQGVTQDYQQAAKWFTKAAGQGQPIAQRNLGIMYANSQGMEQDYKIAAQWYIKAAKQCDVQSQINLGDMYSKGLMSQDDKQPVQWYTKPSEKPVCVKIVKPHVTDYANNSEFKLSPANFPQGVYISATGEPMGSKKSGEILAAQLQDYGFKLVDTKADADVIFSLKDIEEENIIAEKKTGSWRKALSVLDDIAGVVLAKKLNNVGYAADHTPGVVAELANLKQKNIGFTLTISKVSDEKEAKTSFFNAIAGYSKDDGTVSDKLLVLSLDEWAKVHIASVNSK